MRWWPRMVGVCWLVLAAMTASGAAQGTGKVTPAAVAPQEASKDALGRNTPRGTLLGFLNAGRNGEFEVARLYLDTPLKDARAEHLAEQLFAVLDARLPPRLGQVSDAPEGSRSNPLDLNEERIDTIVGGRSQLEIVLERVERPNEGPIWLFSRSTLAGVPAVYEEVLADRAGIVLPRFLTHTRIAGVSLFEWFAILLTFPLLYLAIGLLNRLLTPLARAGTQRVFRKSGFVAQAALPTPARLLIFALASRWLTAALPLSLLPRQILSNAVALLTIGSIAWLMMRLGEETERYLVQRFPSSNTAAISLLRVGRRLGDTLVIFVALLATLRHFGIDPTPALAGLGVGGIAVALAAQKTLENVIAGASLIFDQAVRVGDFLKMGDIVGTVDHIGVRSTRIRTLDRTVVSVPNSQIANASLETISARDKFWFHPVVGLRYESTTDQLHTIIDGIRRLLVDHHAISRESVRVRFIRLGAFSLDVEVFAYVFATDWSQFLEIQERLLFDITDIVDRAGTAIAFPSQTMYVEQASGAVPSSGALEVGGRTVVGS